MDSIEVVLLSELSKICLSLSSAVFSIDSHLEVLLCAVCDDFAEEFCKFCSMLSFFKTSLFPVHTDFRITFSMSDSSHSKVHTYFCAFAFEVSSEAIDDFLLYFFWNISSEFLAYTYLVLCSPSHISLLFYELASWNLALWAELWWDITFIYVTANWTNPFLHNFILRIKL